MLFIISKFVSLFYYLYTHVCCKSYIFIFIFRNSTINIFPNTRKVIPRQFNDKIACVKMCDRQMKFKKFNENSYFIVDLESLTEFKRY